MKSIVKKVDKEYGKEMTLFEILDFLQKTNKTVWGQSEGNGEWTFTEDDVIVIKHGNTTLDPKKIKILVTDESLLEE